MVKHWMMMMMMTDINYNEYDDDERNFFYSLHFRKLLVKNIHFLQSFSFFSFRLFSMNIFFNNNNNFFFNIPEDLWLYNNFFFRILWQFQFNFFLKKFEIFIFFCYLLSFVPYFLFFLLCKIVFCYFIYFSCVRK